MSRPSRVAWRRWVGVVIALVTLTGPVDAQPRVRVEGLAATDLFDMADEARHAGRIEDALTFYDALSGDHDPEVRAEARFRKGVMLADAGRLTEAALAFRALLDEKPSAVPARLELARVLALLGNESAARRELHQARAAGLPADVVATVDQFAQALRSARRLGGSVELSLLPDSNINRATSARTLDTVIAPLTLDDDARARSGLGLKLGGQGFVRLPLRSDLALLPRLAGTADLYGGDGFDDISGSALIGLEWRRARSRWSPSVGQTLRWYGGKPYARTLTASIDWLRSLSPRAQLVVSASAGRANYLRNELQDGHIFDLNLSVERATDARGGIALTASGNRQTARDPGYATASGGVSALAWREAAGSTLFASVGARRTEGDARLFLFPDRRREWLVTARLGATLRPLAVAGFAPVVRATFEKNSSTIGIYDYRRVAGEFGVSRAF